MQELLDRLLANNLADLEGMEIKATIPVKEELANELLASFMSDFFDNAPIIAKKSTDSEYLPLIKTLKPTLLKVSFENGKAVINFELKR